MATMQITEFCGECGDEVTMACDSDALWKFALGRWRCPTCGHINKPCNECFGTEWHDGCDFGLKCPWNDAQIINQEYKKESEAGA